jgi:hypothetical protein
MYTVFIFDPREIGPDDNPSYSVYDTGSTSFLLVRYNPKVS